MGIQVQSMFRVWPVSSLVLALLLAGCDTMPKRVEIPVPIACVRPDQVPTRPPLVLDKEMPKADRGARVLALANYQSLAEPYIMRLEAIAQGCFRVQ
jgi:starvation-inducible outer membrane lipoprotein